MSTWINKETRLAIADGAMDGGYTLIANGIIVEENSSIESALEIASADKTKTVYFLHPHTLDGDSIPLIQKFCAAHRKLARW